MNFYIPNPIPGTTPRRTSAGAGARPSWPALVWLLFATLTALLLRFYVPLSGTVLEALELRSVDARFLVRGPRSEAVVNQVAAQVAIVAIDDVATGRFGRVLPRRVHARLVQSLHQAGARAVVFDVMFIDPNREHPQDDILFARACRAANNVFLPFDDNSTQLLKGQPRREVEAKYAYPLLPSRPERDVRVQPPIGPLLHATRGGGHVATKNDVDGKFRAAILLMEEGAAYPHAAFDAVLKSVWHVAPRDLRLHDGFLHVPGHAPIGPLEKRALTRSVVNNGNGKVEDFAIGDGWMMPLNFLGDHRTMQAMTVSYVDALENLPYLDAQGKRRNTWDRLKGRVVIVGETAPGTPDLRPGPFDTREVFLGVETNATLLANLLATEPQNGFLRRAPRAFAIIITALFGLLCGGGALILRPRAALVFSCAALLIYGFVAALLFINSNLILEIVGPMLSSALGFLALTSYQLVFVERSARESERALLETEALLGQFSNEKLARELRDDPERRLEMQIGTRRDITVLFSDVRGFTSWSERNTPEEVKARLDDYFPIMCEIAGDDYDGFIDKFIGDALMIVWNAHKDQPDHAERAVRAALSMSRALKGLNDGWKKQKQDEFIIGIGIATGSAIFGTFGSNRHKLMPTVLGDTVNLGARLESATKEAGSTIIISQATFEAVEGIFETQPLGVLPIRGKSDAQPIYGVSGLKPTQ